MTSTSVGRRARTRLNPVDVAQFRPHIEQAMKAFEADVTYAVQIARAAVTIRTKRSRTITR